MKKLGKLSIIEEKIISNEELLNLRGGSSTGSSGACCQCTSSGTVVANVLLTSNSDCRKYCKSMGWKKKWNC